MSDRNTPWRNGELVAAPVAAATMIYGGHMVGLMPVVWPFLPRPPP
jgi:hypothetical protein